MFILFRCFKTPLLPLIVPGCNTNLLTSNDIVFSARGLETLIMNLDPRKAAGPDSIPPMFVKRVSGVCMVSPGTTDKSIEIAGMSWLRHAKERCDKEKRAIAKGIMADTPSFPNKLRLITYLSPSLPIEYFEAISHYLEYKLSVPTVLMYESRWNGPPDDRPDPFMTDDIDIAFVNSASYLKLQDSQNEFAELLPVSSVHQHPKGEGKVGYFADVIVHKDRRDETKEFLDLRGCKWAYSKTSSLSGYTMTLQQLKQMGENGTFFGNILPSGSHINSIEMVLQQQVDAATVDANCLANYLDRNPNSRKEIFILESWGPLPPYPIVVNSRLSKPLRQKLIQALLTMHLDPNYKGRLAQFRVSRFAENLSFVYSMERDLIKNVKGLSLDTIYY